MRNKKMWSGVAGLFIMIQLSAQPSQMTSIGMGKGKAEFRLIENGIPQYCVYFDQRPVIKWSGLGFALDKDSSIYKDFEWINNPEAYIIENSTVQNDSILKISLAAGGGCAICLQKVNKN